MKRTSIKYLSILGLILLTGCGSKEEQPAAPAPAAEPVVLKQDMQTLHKAEDLNQVISDTTQEQRKQIEAATQ